MTGKKRYFDKRSDQGVISLGLCIGYEICPEALASWSSKQREEFEIYAERLYLSASDNPVRVPQHPTWLPGPWGGKPDVWGNLPTEVRREPQQ